MRDVMRKSFGLCFSGYCALHEKSRVLKNINLCFFVILILVLIVYKMIHSSGYYDISNSDISSANESNNNTPFSVKDILNLVDQNGEGYLGCHIER